MYVFYPASRLVGLTINYREINQVCPFPPRNPSEEPEIDNEKPDQEIQEADERLKKIEALYNREFFSKKSVSPLPKAKKNKSESPEDPPKKPPRRRKFGKTPKELDLSPETISLQENLKNLKAYEAPKPSTLKRSWSWHLKKPFAFDAAKMSATESTLKEMSHPALNETLKSHNAVTFKLVKTVSEFTESLAHIYEQHAEEMQVLVSNFRKKNSELRKERPACASSLFHTWETLLQEVEIDSQAHSEIASILGRQVSRPLLEKSFFRKIESRKIFSHRETYESMIKQAEEKLGKCRVDYKTNYLGYMKNPSSQSLGSYITSHNEYVAQLHYTNGLLNQYHSDTLPNVLQEIENIYNDLCVKISDSVLQVAEMISSRAQEQAKRYEGLTAQCRSVQGPTDLTHLARSVTIPGNPPPTRRHFAAPQPPAQVGPDGQPLPQDSNASANLPPALKNEIVLDRLTNAQVKDKYDNTKKENSELETQVKQLSDALHTLIRVQQRSVDSNLFNKVNELQEDISMKQHELNVALMRLAGIKAQKELFTNKVESAETGRERKMSSSSTGSMKSKWMKAFKSLKTPPANGTAAKDIEKKNGKDGGTSFGQDTMAHIFQDYTYKKITPCDVCSQVLRGHTRQGLKCRICKVNVHVDCQEKAPKCQQKSRLLRRQKSTSEIDTKIQEPPQEEENVVEVDQVYQVLKQASDLSSKTSTANRIPISSESYTNPNLSPPSASTARPESYLEKTASFERNFERKNDYYYSNPKHSKAYSRSDYQTDFYSGSDFYQHSPPKTYKNRLSDPGVVQFTNAACLGPSAGISGPPCAESGPQPRRQQAPPLLRGPASHSIGPVPVTTSSDEMDTALRRRLFTGIKSFSVFGGKSRGHSPSNRSISLPENAERTRPFGQPLFLGATSASSSSSVQENGGLVMKSSLPSTPQPKHKPRPVGTDFASEELGIYSQYSFKASHFSLSEDKITPHSPRRQKLNLRMKSLSLDSPESTEHAQKRRAQATHSAGHSSQSSSSKIHSPSSPVHNRRLLSARNMRMSSVELPDDNEKSLSSASTSPCPSPKPHRLLPTNLYVVLYNFKSRHPDELDLKAGYKVTVMDTSDPDWWKGKCLGRVGYFPSKYVIKLEPGERPLQVTHNLQVQDGDTGIMLLRDQIVIQVGEDVDGMVMIRSADNKQGACPVKFLQEV